MNVGIELARHMLRYLQMLFYWAVEFPILTLYMRGPAMAGYGFFEGLPQHEICSRITGVPSQHWISSQQASGECVAAIQRKISAIVVLVFVVLYAFALVLLLQIVVRRLKKWWC